MVARRSRATRDLAEPVRRVLLDLPSAGGAHRKPPRANLSAVALHGSSLFLGTDEGTVLDRLTRVGDDRFAEPRVFPLLDALDLPNKTGEDDEIDIEGIDVEGDLLWLVGSHTWTRGKPKDDPLTDLTKVRANPNRHVLACLPLLPDGDDLHALPAGPGSPGVARLPIGKKQSALAKALKKDPHLAAFRKIPSKENGFDVEGVAAKDRRLLLGLRGPVLRGVAVVLELAVEPDGQGGLALKPLAEDGRRAYRKHLLDLNGNGVRDLHRDGDDLLILAGPTADLDGRCWIWRWRDAWADEADSYTEGGKRLERLIRIPVGVDADHPEGIALIPGSDGCEVMVVYDSPAKARCHGGGGVDADVFALPPR